MITSIEKECRELLAQSYDREGFSLSAEMLRNQKDLPRDLRAALNALMSVYSWAGSTICE